METLSSSCSISGFERKICNPTMSNKSFRFQVEMSRTESPSRLGTNGRPVKMVPTSEVAETNTSSYTKVKMVNGKRQVINGASLVKKSTSSALVRTPKGKDLEELPPVEDLKVLPSDESFSWANENYNSLQRSIDVWSFVLSLRVRILFDNAKWTYVGGFSENKQVDYVFKLAWNFALLQSVLLSYFSRILVVIILFDSEKQKKQDCLVAEGACTAAWSNFY